MVDKDMQMEIKKAYFEGFEDASRMLRGYPVPEDWIIGEWLKSVSACALTDES